MQRVFIADDDEDDILILQSVISEVSPGTKCTSVSNGTELLRSLEQNTSPNPDFIILDINMPVMNGFETLANLRAHPRLSDIPVIIYSTTGETKDLFKTYEAGADHFITKQTEYADLTSIIKKLLGIRFNNHYHRGSMKQFQISV